MFLYTTQSRKGVCAALMSHQRKKKQLSYLFHSRQESRFTTDLLDDTEHFSFHNPMLISSAFSSDVESKQEKAAFSTFRLKEEISAGD
jgi:hypothetical protein